MVRCRGCEQEKRHHAKGYCSGCYKREVWRPTRNEAVQREYETSNRRWTRLRQQLTRGDLRPRHRAKCGCCSKFKPRPSSVCGSCGDDPVTHNGDRWMYDREHGFDD